MRAPLRKLGLVGLLFLATLVVVGLPTWGQEAVEPSGELATAECYGHHKTEGFRSMDLFPQVISEVPKGQPFEFQMTVRNPWLHEIRQAVGYVNISGAPGLSFPGAREPAPVAFDGTPSSGQPASHAIPVEANATSMIVSLVGQASGLPRLGGADYALVVKGPDGSEHVDPTQAPPERPVPGAPPTSGRLRANVVVEQTNLTKGGPGDWTATVTYSGVQPQGSYRLEAVVYYNLSQSQELVVAGPEVLKPGESFTFSFTIHAKDVEALQALRYGGRATAYHEHTDKNIGDDGEYDKWNTVQFNTGTQLRIGSATVDQGAGVSLLEPVFRRWGQVLGFAGSFLIIPSLVFGGTFGRASVDVLNRWFGGARRRVLFHNSMSFWLLGIAVLHMFIFLYEAFWSWSHGLVWGGLALASMIGLGVTGATQRRFVARWGFMRWRFVHFAMGVLVFVFVLIHVVADGSHLAPIRTLLFGPEP